MLSKTSKQHLYYLDFIRVFLTLLVFYHHSAIAFGASGGWYYKAKELVSGGVEGLLSINMGINQSYFMSLFFFISAYLMPASFDRKGVKLFIEDRIKRLVIPLSLYFFVINPLLVYWIYGSAYEVGLGPMWFVFTLLVFELSYVIYRITGQKIHLSWKLPTLLPTLCFILFMGTWAFLMRLAIPTGVNVFGLQLGYYPLYIGMYYLGLIAYRNQWLEQLSLKNGYRWMLFLLFIIFPLFLFNLKECTDLHLLNGGWNRFSLSYAFWEPFMCVGICYFLLAFAKRYFNYPSKRVEWLAKTSYAFYIIHPVVLVGCTFVAEQIPVSPFFRFLITFCIGIPLCVVAGELFKRFLSLFRIRI